MNLPTVFHYIAFVIGILTIIIGVAAIYKPEFMSKNFGIYASGAALPYVMSTGIRDIFMGLTVLILFFRHEWVILGAINLCIGAVAISDFVLVQKYGNKKMSLAHLFGAVAVTGFGIWLVV